MASLRSLLVAEPPTAHDTDVQHDRTRQLLVGVGLLAVLFVVGYLIFVATAWGHEYDNDAYLGREGEGRFLATAGGHLLSRVTAGVLALGLVVVVTLAALQRILIVGFIAALGITAAMVGAQILKATLPWSALTPSDSTLPAGLFRETYPSGHTTIGMTFAFAALLIIPAHARWWAAPIAGIFASIFAVGVVIAGWHRPSDAIGGACWSGVVMSLAAVLAVLARGGTRHDSSTPLERESQRRSSLVRSVIIASAIYLLLLLLAAFVGRELPDADLAFIVMIGLILVTVFGVQWWFGSVLAEVDWRRSIDDRQPR